METLNLFKEVSEFKDEHGNIDINSLITYSLKEYFALIKSEKIAKRELERYGLEFKEVYPERKERYQVIFDYMRANNIDVPGESFNFGVTVGDVINRINEQRDERIREIEDKEESYFDYAFDQEIMEDAEEEIAMISEKFDEISSRYIRKAAIIRERTKGKSKSRTDCSRLLEE